VLRAQDGRRKIQRINLKLGYSLQHLHLRHSFDGPVLSLTKGFRTGFPFPVK